MVEKSGVEKIREKRDTLEEIAKSDSGVAYIATRLLEVADEAPYTDPPGEKTEETSGDMEGIEWQ